MHILLDFDNVFFSNKQVHSIVEDRSVAYVKHRLNTKTTREARYINTLTYHVKGHTALMFENNHEAIHDYNRFVFDEAMLYRVNTLVDKHDITHAERLVSLRRRVPSKYKMHLCTNTTLSYCETVVHAMDMSMTDMFDMSYVFTSENGLAKPCPEYWTYVEQTLPPDGRLVLVDDSPLNILGVTTLPRWDAVLINNPEDLYTFLSILISDNF